MIAQIPPELRSVPQWLVWKSIPNSSGIKPIKIPLCPKTLNAASVTDHATWSTFLTAYRTLQNNSQLAGLGFVFTESDPYTGIDLDDCKTDIIKPEALEYINLLDSYTEISPSGFGFHIICKGHLPPGGRKNGWIEMYDSGRFFCFTGDVWEQHKEITEREDALAKFHKWIFTERDRFQEVVQKILYIPDGRRHDAIRAEAWSMARQGYPLEETMEFCMRLATINGFTGKRLREVERLVYSAYDKVEQKIESITFQVSKSVERVYDASNLNWEVPKIEWLVPGLFPKNNLIFLAGQSQTGKSIFMGYAAIAMACGVPFGIFKGIQK
ncbi:AAA family ATPase, partial [bacterium]|nr:AAA family ATPase [bacterium]